MVALFAYPLLCAPTLFDENKGGEEV